MGIDMEGFEAGSPGDIEKLIVRNIEAMAFEPSEFEAATYIELMALPRVIVTRPPTKDLVSAGFVHYDCHRNCGNQVDNDPSGNSRHVVGWLPYGKDLILHSVVVIGERWFCLTPQFVDAPDRFEFIPDNQLIWHDQGPIKIVRRHGREIPEVFRKNPMKHIRMRDAFRALVAEGRSIVEARDMVANDSRFRQFDR